MKWKIVLVLVVWSLFLIRVMGQPDMILQCLDAAEQYYSQQEYVEAVKTFDECFKDSDELIPLHLSHYGLSAQKTGDFKKAKALFLELEKIDTTQFTFAKSLATIYETENNIPKAIKYYRLLTKKFPENGIYFRKLGQLNLEVGEVFDAFPNFKKAYEINDKDVFAIQGLSEIFLANNQYAQIDSLLMKAINYDQENYTLNLLKARSKYKQKQYDSTAIVLYKLSNTTTLNNYYNKMLGYAFLQIDSLDKAILFLERSLVDEKNPENALYYLATAYEKKEDTTMAIYYFERSIEAGVSKNQAIYHKNLGRIFDKNKETKKAIKQYEAAYRYSEDPLMLFYLARASDVYYKDKKIAMRYYERYSKSKHDNEEYKKYAIDRRRYLKEQQHLSK